MDDQDTHCTLKPYITLVGWLVVLTTEFPGCVGLCSTEENGPLAVLNKGTGVLINVERFILPS